MNPRARKIDLVKLIAPEDPKKPYKNWFQYDGFLKTSTGIS